MLARSGCVFAYPDIATAREQHRHGEPVFVSRSGAKRTAFDCELVLLREDAPKLLGLAQAAPTAVLDDSLLRTNVQKAVRRKDGEAARRSVLQYLLQPRGTGVTEARRKLLARLPIIAAEDAGAVPLLASAVWFYLAATSTDVGGTEFAATVAACAAQLAEQDRPTWVAGGRTHTVQKAAWDDPSWTRPPALAALDLGALKGSAGRSVPPAEMGLLIAVGVAADNAHDPQEKLWLQSLEKYVYEQVTTSSHSQCPFGCAPHAECPKVGAQQQQAQDPAPLGEDGALLPSTGRFFFSADFHGAARWGKVVTALRGNRELGGVSEKAFKDMAKEESYLNVRDHPTMHLLNLPQPVKAPRGGGWEEIAKKTWTEVATVMWSAQAGGQGKGAGSGKGVGGGKRASSGGGGDAGPPKKQLTLFQQGWGKK